MADQNPDKALAVAVVEALKALGKALGQMTLYKVGHPAVGATIATAREKLEEAIALSPDRELKIGVDGAKLIANGRVVSTTSQLPRAIPAIFMRFRLATIVFRSDVAEQEIAAFCELSSLRLDDPASNDPKAFLEMKGVGRIRLNEGYYAKVEGPPSTEAAPDGGEASPTNPPETPKVPQATDARAAEALDAFYSLSADQQLRELNEALAESSLDHTLEVLVERAVPDPDHRNYIRDQVLRLLEKDLERRVEEVVHPLTLLTKQVQNDAARSTSLLQNIVDGVVVVDEEGKILLMNTAAEEIYGVPLAQTAGKTLTEVKTDEVIVALAAELETPSDRDIAPDVTVAGVADTQRTLRASNAIVKTESGKIVGMVTALPQKAKVRELAKMQRDFVAHVTHELRAPLSSIRAALEIIQADFAAQMEEEDSRVLDSALKNSDRLADMITGILDFSKIESGQMTLHPKPCEAAAIARDGVDGLKPWATKKGITLSLEAPDGLPQIEADPPRAVQVLVNLLSNAIKFTPKDGRIDVRLAKRVEEADAFVEFAVADSGPGIAAAEREKVFEKFVQISSGEELHTGGTGLGLSIARALVKLHGGRMWVDGEEGKGAVFHFTLPIYNPPVADATKRRGRNLLNDSWWKGVFGLK